VCDHARAEEDSISPAETTNDGGEVLETRPRSVVEAMIDGHDHDVLTTIEEALKPDRLTRRHPEPSF
jgi:hypothetical protein